MVVDDAETPLQKESAEMKKEVAEEEVREEKVELDVQKKEEVQEKQDAEVKDMDALVDVAKTKTTEAKVHSKQTIVAKTRELTAPDVTAKIEKSVEEAPALILKLPPAMQEEAKQDLAKTVTTLKKAKKEEAAAAEAIHDAALQMFEVKNEAQTDSAATEIINEFGTMDALHEKLEACHACAGGAK